MARSPPAAAAGSATEDDEEIDEIDLTQDTDEEDSASGVGMLLSPVPVKAEPDAEPGPAGTHFKLRLRFFPVLTQWPCV